LDCPLGRPFYGGDGNPDRVYVCISPHNMFGSNQDLLSYISDEHNDFHGKCQNNNPDSIGVYPIASTRAAAASPTVRYI
jgi:hypothetical protein